MASYQIPKDRQGYKNPKIESPSSLRKTPTAPVQSQGLMAAAARARSLRPGIPPIPTLQSVDAAQPVEAAPSAAAAAPKERPVSAPINIQFGMPPAAPRAEAARTIAEKERATEGAPEGGLAGMGYDTGYEAFGGGSRDRPEAAKEAAKEAAGEAVTPAPSKEPVYDDQGNEIGLYDPETGVTTHFAPDEEQFGQEESNLLETVEAKTAKVKEKVEPWLWDYMGQSLGIDEEQIAGQIEQLKMAESDELAQFAQQMAARGMGASGLVGAGMGQIVSSTMAAMANVRFEAAKVAVEDRLNRIKAYMSFYGNMLSEEIRAAMQEEMNSLGWAQFDYEQQQGRVADSWMRLANWAATNGAKHYEEGVVAEINKHLHTVNPNTGKYYTWDEITQEFLGMKSVADPAGGTYLVVSWEGMSYGKNPAGVQGTDPEFDQWEG